MCMNRQEAVTNSLRKDTTFVWPREWAFVIFCLPKKYEAEPLERGQCLLACTGLSDTNLPKRMANLKKVYDYPVHNSGKNSCNCRSSCGGEHLKIIFRLSKASCLLTFGLGDIKNKQRVPALRDMVPAISLFIGITGITCSKKALLCICWHRTKKILQQQPCLSLLPLLKWYIHQLNPKH